MSCEFSTKHYREILETGLKKGYEFTHFEDTELAAPGRKICILRHDIDYLPEGAIRFAEIENELGVKATYFFQICAKTYNLRETANYQTVHKLAQVGHTIGLHFDWMWKEDLKWEEMVESCERDKEVFKAVTGLTPCEIISFHNPHRYVEYILDQDIKGMRHTYEKAFFSKIKYLSDSQGWYEGCMCKIFEEQKYSAVQLCTHPYIWPEIGTGDFIEDVANLVKHRTEELIRYCCTYHPVCKKNEPKLRTAVRGIPSEKV